MSIDAIPACGLGVTAATLSAWRDAALSSADTERVGAHVAQCPACQERLAEYETLARRLRTQRVPEPDARLWLAVRAGMPLRPRRARFRPAAPTGAAWRSLAAVAAVLLVVAGFAEALHSVMLGRITGRATPAVMATATAAPLSWQQDRPPPFWGANMSLGNIAVTPSDGHTAYACAVSAVASGSQLAVWVTHDRAAHWTPTTSAPVGQTTALYARCSITVDEIDARTVAAVLDWEPARQGPDLTQTATYVTTDGGGSWRQLSGQEPFTISQLATGQGVTYALRAIQPPSPQPGTGLDSLSASSDGMRTWRTIDQALTAQGLEITAFWLDPRSGAIVAEAATTGGEPKPLWRTSDGGQTWTQVPGPVQANIAVQAPSAGAPWHLCALSQDSQDSAGHPAQTDQLLCSTDGGLTWQQRPTVNYTFTCYKCVAGGTPTTEVFPMGLVAIADDGAVLATVDVPQAPVSVPSSGGPPPILTLYRLPVGGSTWQSLGALPHSVDARTGQIAYGTLIYAAGPGPGLLWSIATDGTILTAVYA